MIPPKVKLIGNTGEAERLKGFALSQLQILHNTMKFQGLKQYTRVVRFCDGSFVRAFSSFGIDTVTVFVPPVSIPEREIVEIEEGVYVAPEPCEVALEVPSPTITTDCDWQWVLKAAADVSENCTVCNDATPPPVYDVEYIVGTQKWVLVNGYGAWFCASDCVTTSWDTADPDWVEPPCGTPWGCKQGACSHADPPCSGYYVSDRCLYYEWECV